MHSSLLIAFSSSIIDIPEGGPSCYWYVKSTRVALKSTKYVKSDLDKIWEEGQL